jgi:hypothetical protein
MANASFGKLRQAFAFNHKIIFWFLPLNVYILINYTLHQGNSYV